MECSTLCIITVIVFAVIIKLVRARVKLSGLHTRHVFITGCDSGFGRLLAVRLDKKGIPVYAGCLLEKSMQELKDSCSSRLKPVQVNVTDTESVRAAANYVKADLKGKGLWAIVNNAGVSGVMCPFEWTTKEDCRETIEVNLLGVYDVTLHFLPLIRRGKEGRIVNIASVGGRIGFGASGYIMSKFGVEGFSDGLSFDMDAFNITVHTLEPGFFKTNLTNWEIGQKLLLRSFNQTSPEIREQYGGKEFLDKIGTFIRKMLEENSSPRIELVVDAYEHALFSKYPHNRYHVGVDSQYFFIPLSFLPFKLLRWILNTLQTASGNKKPMPKNYVGK